MTVKVSFGTSSRAHSTFARINIDLAGKLPKRPKGNHRIKVIDCSQSMSGSIEQVRDDTIASIEKMGANDFVSVLIFSGHGTAKRIAGPTRTDAAGKRLVTESVKRNVRLIGTTVFSEALALALQSAKEAAGEDLMHHTILFTDGCAVPTNWSVATEKQRSIAQAAELGSFGAFLSCLGYGFYYDDKFLRNLVAANGGDGIYQHISDIDDFAQAMESIEAVAQNLTPLRIELTVSTEKGSGTRAFRTLPEVSEVGTNKGSIRVSAVYENGADIYVELPAGSKSVKVQGTVGGSKVDAKIEAFKDDDEAAFLRILGVSAFVNGDLATAQAMFEMTGDDQLAENLGNAFSTRDVRDSGNVARAYFREKKFIGAGLKKVGPNHCLLNLLRVLVEDPDTIVHLPRGAYKRGGVATKDPRVVRNPGGGLLVVTDFLSSDERFNFSVRVLEQIGLLPEGEADQRKARPSQIYRTYNILRDGNLVMPELIATLSKESFAAVQEAEVIGSGEVWKKGKFYTLDLRGLKTTSSAFANPKTLRLVDLFKEEKDLMAEQTPLNAHLKALGHKSKAGTVEGEIYHPISAVDDSVEIEYYDAECCKYAIMKYKVKSAYDCTHMTYDEADKRVKEVRQQLTAVRQMKRTIVYSMEKVGSKVIKWDAGEVNKHGKFEQSAIFEGVELKRTAWSEQTACS